MALRWPRRNSTRVARPGPQRPRQDEVEALQAQLDVIASRLVALDDMNTRLDAIGENLSRIERLGHGGRAVYLGNGRILAKTTIGDTTLGYLLEADDRLLVPQFVVTGVHEPEVTEFFLQNVKPSDHCLDVGANFGYYTCLMARLAPQGKTIGIEPDRHVFELLRDNIYINCLEGSANSMEAAVGAEAGTLRLHRRLTRSGNTSIAKVPDEFTRMLGEADSEPFEVGCLTIDQLLPQFDGRIDILKIDVEGAEPLVFAGAREALARNPGIRIVMEWSPGQLDRLAPAEFTEMLRGLGLNPALIEMGGVSPIGWDDLLGHTYWSGVLLTRDGT